MSRTVTDVEMECLNSLLTWKTATEEMRVAFVKYVEDFVPLTGTDQLITRWLGFQRGWKEARS